MQKILIVEDDIDIQDIMLIQKLPHDGKRKKAVVQQPYRHAHLKRRL